MKRALSLILVLAMVLCLVPFSAFADGEVWGLDGVYADGNVTLNADNNYEASALYTVPEAGTVCFNLTVPEGVEGVNIYLSSSEETSEVTDEAYVLGTYINVVDGEELEVTVSYDNASEGAEGVEVSISHDFLAVPGTVNNPFDMYTTEGSNPTVILMPDESVYYNVYGIKGKNVQIYGEGIKVNFDGGEHFTSDEMIATFIEGTIMEGYYVPVLVKFTNKSDTAQYYQLYATAPETPVGAYGNPHYISETGVAQNGTVAEASDGYYYTYYAEDYGTATISVATTDAEGNALGWTYTVNNITSSKYGDQQWSDSDPVVNPWVVEVSQGDEIQIIVNTYNAADPWGAPPAGNVSVTVNFEADPVVAVYNDTEYKRLGDALDEIAASWWNPPSAEAPAVITLVGDAVVDSIVELDAYVTLDLADYTLTAPNVLAYENSVLTGNVGTAAINSTYVVANNVTIEDVEYAWTANDGVYTLVEYKAPTAEDDEPEVASYNGETMGLNAAIAAAAADYALDGEVKTVTLVDDADYTGKTIIIEPGVKLDIVNFDLTARNLIGLSGSYLTATTEDSEGAGGRLIVGKDNVALSSEAVYYADGNYQRAVTPVWDTANNNYIFTGFMFYKASFGTDVNGEVDGTATMTFYPNCKSYIREFFKDDQGTVDNNITMVIRASYKENNGTIDVTREYAFSPYLTGAAGRSTSLNCVMDGCNLLSDLEFSYVIISGTGIEVVVDGYTY